MDTFLVEIRLKGPCEPTPGASLRPLWSKAAPAYTVWGQPQSAAWTQKKQVKPLRRLPYDPESYRFSNTRVPMEQGTSFPNQLILLMFIGCKGKNINNQWENMYVSGGVVEKFKTI